MQTNDSLHKPSFTFDLIFVLVLSAIMTAIAYWILLLGNYYGVLVTVSSLIPILAARLYGLDLKRIIPDVIFGAIDTGLLTVAALVGASYFGIIGAIVGGVIGDAITDGVAGFFEGGISEWLRSLGIDESRTAIGSCCGKRVGCLLGSGMALVFTDAMSITPTI